MVKYTTSLFKQTVQWSDLLPLSGNLAALAIFYSFLGALVSFVMYYIFDEYGPDENPPRGVEWAGKGTLFQVYDIIVEISIISSVSFWVTYMINTSAPIFPMRPVLSSLVDSYTTGMFFMYTVFLFSNDFTNKLKHLYQETLGRVFDKIFPTEGSILDFSLRYKSRKTEQNKTT